LPVLIDIFPGMTGDHWHNLMIYQNPIKINPTPLSIQRIYY